MTLRLLVVMALVLSGSANADGNRLAHLTSDSPYYVGRTFPKLTTPQWVGEDGVEAVVVLAIDDMRDHRRYEEFLRPVLDRLKRIDGRAPVSIMTNRIDPATPQLQEWLKEGLSNETHTVDHPCPLLAGGDFTRAKGTYDRCIDQIAAIPGNLPVAFRMPCCDSLNTPSPRFWAEIFNAKTPGGRFLSIDSSVFNITTANDPDLPRELVLDADGRERFRKYVPFDSFVNTIEDYPYPYVINRFCWQFPCATPSDWQAQYVHKPNNPTTTADWKALLDATVVKKGVMNLVFHPHGWCSPQMLIELIDHAEAKHGKKVKFLTFREANERLTKNLTLGTPLRNSLGGDNGVRLMDLNADGFIDVVVGNDQLRKTRVWSPKENKWIEGEFAHDLTKTVVQFGVLSGSGAASLLVRDGAKIAQVAHFDGAAWQPEDTLLKGLEAVTTTRDGKDAGVRLVDLDGDGRCEILHANGSDNAVYRWDAMTDRWQKLPFALPAGARVVRDDGRDAGLRLVDLDEDGALDLIYADGQRSLIVLFKDLITGWSRIVPANADLPSIVRSNGTNNGMWVHSRHLWWQNEDTNKLANLVDRRAFNTLLKEVEPQPKSPAASLASMRVAPGLKVELVAAEPLVQTPVHIAFGPDGKMWVTEMGSYPTEGKTSPGGRVRYLEDTDGDGTYEKSTLFLDGLAYPTGTLPWRDGVLVTCAPDIFFARDTNGDGKADQRDVLFTGFTQGNPQHLVNGLSWGLDNWVYGANGDSGGNIKSTKKGTSVSISGRDFRFKPDTGEFEAVAGMTQFGRSRSDAGDWFGCNNVNPIWHFVLDAAYLKRNPHVVPPSGKVDVPRIPGSSPVFAISRTLPRFNDYHTADHFTSACSVHVYRDHLIPPVAGSSWVYVCEPVHNLVNRQLMHPQGVTFTSDRAPAEQKTEFLASSDNYFRPVTVTTGPDGALYIADMYRLVIEHPEWIPKEWQQKRNLRAGEDKGRIYRVSPIETKSKPAPRLDKLTTDQLVAALDSPSGWQRDTAHMLLLWRADKSAAPLEKLLTDSANPLARLHALCVLDGLGQLSSDPLIRRLLDPHPAVRRHAARLFPRIVDPKTQPKLSTDRDSHVRLQWAYSLGDVKADWPAAQLAELATTKDADRFLLAAVASSLHAGNIVDFTKSVVDRSKSNPLPADLLAAVIRTATGTGKTEALSPVVAAITRAQDDRYQAWQFQSLAALLDALEQSKSSLSKLAESEGLKDAVNDVAKVLTAARAVARDDQAMAVDRTAAISLLLRDPESREQDLNFIRTALSPQSRREVQSAAIATLAARRDPETPALIIAALASFSPQVRNAAVDVLLARAQWTTPLLDVLEKKEIQPNDIDPTRRQRLLQSSDSAIRARATQLLTQQLNPNRQAVLDSFAHATQLKGDATRGQQVFARACATCHTAAGQGNTVGPELAAVGDKTPVGLLISILDPNRAVEPRYQNYIAETNDGDTHTGILVSELDNVIKLLGPDGQSVSVLRKNLKDLRPSKTSLMPEGLEASVTLQDMADLIAFIQGVK